MSREREIDKVVRPHIWYWTTWSSAVRGNEIPDGIWDGTQNAFAPLKPRKSKDANLELERKRLFEMIAEDLD